MATIQVESVLAITVDRGTRDVLRNCLRSETYRLEDFERVISGSDRQAAHEALALPCISSRCSTSWGGRTTIRAITTKSL